MKSLELREKSLDELKQTLLQLMRQQFKLRMQKGIGEVPSPHLFKQLRRSIARVKTILREKQ